MWKMPIDKLECLCYDEENRQKDAAMTKCSAIVAVSMMLCVSQGCLVLC